MGQQISSSQNNIAIRQLIRELKDLEFVKIIGNSTLLKTVVANHLNSKLIVKIFFKSINSSSISNHIVALEKQRNLLLNIQNILPFQIIVETDKLAYCIRQFIHGNLYDRISTRPFLQQIEKKWIAFQILTALVESHAKYVSQPN